MIAASREYIKSQVNKCNAEYREIDDPVGDNDISLSLVDRNYKTVFGPLTTLADGNFHTDTVDVTVELYKRAGSREVEAFDELYDLAINVKNTIMDPLIVKNSEDFSDIIFQGIGPQPLPTNDKVFKILLTFQIRKDFDYQGV